MVLVYKQTNLENKTGSPKVKPNSYGYLIYVKEVVNWGRGNGTL